MFPFWQCRTIPSLHQLCSKLICFLCYRPCRIFFSPFISKASRRVSSFFLSIQSSQPYVATGHISAFIRRIFVETIFCDFSIFSAVMPRSPAAYFTWYGIPSYTHHLLQSGTQGTGTYPPAPVAYSE